MNMSVSKTKRVRADIQSPLLKDLRYSFVIKNRARLGDLSAAGSVEDYYDSLVVLYALCHRPTNHNPTTNVQHNNRPQASSPVTRRSPGLQLLIRREQLIDAQLISR